MPAPETTSSSKAPWWLESLLWTLGIAVVLGTAAYLNETAREILAQGLAYVFAFFSTPFVLETSCAIIGLCIVIAINNRRLEREGDGWVEMEIEDPVAKSDVSVGQTPTDKASKV